MVSTNTRPARDSVPTRSATTTNVVHIHRGRGSRLGDDLLTVQERQMEQNLPDPQKVASICASRVPL